MKFFRVVLPVLVLIPILLSSCNSGNVAQKAQPIESVKPKNIASTPAPSKKITDIDTFDKDYFPLIASLPKDDFYLYGIKPGGVILYHKGIGKYFAWSYMTPRFILPTMKYKDFDSDGKKELAVTLYWGSGTSYIGMDLHMLEVTAFRYDKNSKDPHVDDMIYKDHYLSNQSCVKLLKKHLRTKILYEGNNCTVNLKLDGKKITVPTSKLIESGNKITGVTMVDMVSFEIKKTGLKTYITIGLLTEKYAEPAYFGDFIADVKYSKGKFSLINCKYIKGGNNQ